MACTISSIPMVAATKAGNGGDPATLVVFFLMMVEVFKRIGVPGSDGRDRT